jgi:predicted aconitase with swiveling domain
MDLPRAIPLIGAGGAEGEALVLTAPISFWGGVDPGTGLIVDARHPQRGECVSGRILFLPGTIGSSSASLVLLELVHAARAPAAILLHETDAILLLGLVAAGELGLAVPPAMLFDRRHHGRIAPGPVRLLADGTIEHIL